MQRQASGTHHGRVRLDVSGYRQRRREARSSGSLSSVADDVRGSRVSRRHSSRCLRGRPQGRPRHGQRDRRGVHGVGRRGPASPGGHPSGGLIRWASTQPGASPGCAPRRGARRRQRAPTRPSRGSWSGPGRSGSSGRGRSDRTSTMLRRFAAALEGPGPTGSSTRPRERWRSPRDSFWCQHGQRRTGASSTPTHGVRRSSRTPRRSGPAQKGDGAAGVDRRGEYGSTTRRDAGLRGRLRSSVVARSFGKPAVTAECAAPASWRWAAGWVVSEPPAPHDDDVAGGEHVDQPNALIEGCDDHMGGSRWDAEGLAILGLEDAGQKAGCQVLRATVLCPDRYPRRVGIPLTSGRFDLPRGTSPASDPACFT